MSDEPEQEMTEEALAALIPEIEPPKKPLTPEEMRKKGMYLTTTRFLKAGDREKAKAYCLKNGLDMAEAYVHAKIEDPGSDEMRDFTPKYPKLPDGQRWGKVMKAWPNKYMLTVKFHEILGQTNEGIMWVTNHDLRNGNLVGQTFPLKRNPDEFFGGWVPAPDPRRMA